MVGKRRMIRAGDIGFSHRRDGVYSRGVRFVTGYYTHCFVGIPEIFGEPALIEADYKVQVVSFRTEYVEKTCDDFELWRPLCANDEDIYNATKEIYYKYAGKTYGFMQIPWFMWQRLCKLIGINPGRNWFPAGVICSELAQGYLELINPLYKEAFPFTLDEVNPDMLYEVVSTRPDLFVKIEVYKK
jgi:hypothetical protein